MKKSLIKFEKKENIYNLNNNLFYNEINLNYDFQNVFIFIKECFKLRIITTIK